MKNLFLIALLSIFVMGCSTGKSSYTKPNESNKVSNSITVSKTKSQVWKSIVPALGNSFFVINNIDKESGFINVSYSGDPEKYIDCGVIKSYVSNLAGERTYEFPAASAYQHYEVMPEGLDFFNIKRKMNLVGRINLILQELSQNETLITVNVKYAVTKSLRTRNLYDHLSLDTVSISFNTNGGAVFPSGTTCNSIGTLELEILGNLGL